MKVTVLYIQFVTFHPERYKEITLHSFAQLAFTLSHEFSFATIFLFTGLFEIVKLSKAVT